jgi:hypothetical protein
MTESDHIHDEEEVEQYCVDTHCSNCHDQSEWWFDKGTVAFSKGPEVCENCGCKTVRQAEWRRDD